MRQLALNSPDSMVIYVCFI